MGKEGRTLFGLTVITGLVASMNSACTPTPDTINQTIEPGAVPGETWNLGQEGKESVRSGFMSWLGEGPEQVSNLDVYDQRQVFDMARELAEEIERKKIDDLPESVAVYDESLPGVCLVMAKGLGFRIIEFEVDEESEVKGGIMNNMRVTKLPSPFPKILALAYIKDLYSLDQASTMALDGLATRTNLLLEQVVSEPELRMSLLKALNAQDYYDLIILLGQRYRHSGTKGEGRSDFENGVEALRAINELPWSEEYMDDFNQRTWSVSGKRFGEACEEIILNYPDLLIDREELE